MKGGAMLWKKGTRVKHPTKPEWGVGEVVEHSTAVAVRVFFSNAGLKSLLPTVKLDVVTGAAAKSATLDTLSAKALDPNARYISVPHAIERFMELYPQGFYGKTYLSRERDYKLRASKKAKDLLNAKRLRNMLQKGSQDDGCHDALRVINATNLVFPNEKMALKDGLIEKRAQARFLETLCGLLERSDLSEEAFMAFARTLQDIGAAKWTIATYYQYLVFPETHMFVKPTVTQKAAELSAFDLNYKPELNWLTYLRVLEFAGRLREQLTELRPRDMIDVQSFMWYISPEI